MTQSNIELLGLSGSIRRQSINTAVLEALRQRLDANQTTTLTLFSLAELPLFSTDLESEDPPTSVATFQYAVRVCHGIVVCSPEYNHGTSGVLKNALDWASRPASNCPLKGKPALVMTAAPGLLGGVRALHQVRDTLFACHARVISRPDVIITRAQEKMSGGRFVDEPTLSFAMQAIADLVAEIRLLERR